MRIGIDCRLWNETGVGRYTRNLIDQLAKIDKENHYTLFFRSKEFNEIKLPGDNFEKRIADVRWHTIAEQIYLASIIDKEMLDLVHFPYFSVPIFYRRPFIITIHDLILHHFPTGEASTLPGPLYWIKLQGYKFVISQAVKKAKKILTVSEATKQEIIDHFSIKNNKITVTYEGVDAKISNLKSQISNKYKIQNTKYFLYVGNAYPHKNLDRLLEAFHIVLRDSNNVELILVGKEDYFYKRLQKKVSELGLVKNIFFKGYVSDEELSQLYQNAQTLIVPSRMEGFGLPILEAMANNCLVLASDIPVHREIAQDAAIFFNPHSVEDIAKKMKNVLDSGNTDRYSEMKKKGIERDKEFSWKNMAAQTLTVYESCIGIRPG